jgi:hypothetical protein
MTPDTSATVPPISEEPMPLTCSPGRFFCQDPGVMPAHRQSAQDRTREPPALLLEPDQVWRDACQMQVAHIPAGYTYLMQLLGHDMGHSVPLDMCPATLRGKGARTLGVSPPNRYNLIENPATLETIYGPGPWKLPFLYDPETLLFRVVPTARLAQLFTVGSTSAPGAPTFNLRALYDERNRDTIMLHELAVVWMQFHNHCARILMEQSIPPDEAFARTRAHCVRVWHRIIRDDILPRFIHQDMVNADLHPEWALSETTLLSGLFRAFHALPLDSYRRNSKDSHNLGDLMKKGYDTSQAEESRWFIDWLFFLGGAEDSPHAGISVSVSSALQVQSVSLAQMDLNTAKVAYPNRMGSRDFSAKWACLPVKWRARITAARLSADFADRFHYAPIRPTEDNLKWGPIYYPLMVEAQLYGHQGGLGPLGSALLRTSVLTTLARVRLPPATKLTATLPFPTTMLCLITATRKSS